MPARTRLALGSARPDNLKFPPLWWLAHRKLNSNSKTHCLKPRYATLVWGRTLPIWTSDSNELRFNFLRRKRMVFEKRRNDITNMGSNMLHRGPYPYTNAQTNIKLGPSHSTITQQMQTYTTSLCGKTLPNWTIVFFIKCAWQTKTQIRFLQQMQRHQHHYWY
jgi:hypothetical protein